jgi:hypothetical protein
MRHSPTNSARPARRSSESISDSHRAGIRALDCGSDDGEAVSPPITRQTDSALEHPLADGVISLGEQQQAL